MPYYASRVHSGKRKATTWCPSVSVRLSVCLMHGLTLALPGVGCALSCTRRRPPRPDKSSGSVVICYVLPVLWVTSFMPFLGALTFGSVTEPCVFLSVYVTATARVDRCRTVERPIESQRLAAKQARFSLTNKHSRTDSDRSATMRMLQDAMKYPHLLMTEP